MDDEIEWLSPIASDGYAEYRDDGFMDRLGIADTRVALKAFWPVRGLQWDGLARTKSGKFILVEAKAYPNEAKSGCQATDQMSLRMISKSLDDAKQFFGAPSETSWHRPDYQYANRLAHLYYLRELNGFDAFLVFLNFANAPDVQAPCSVEHWPRAVGANRKILGLPSDKRPEGVATIVWDVANMQKGHLR